MVFGALTAACFPNSGTSQQPVVTGVQQTGEATIQNRNSAPACESGMKYIKGDRISDETDGTGGWTMCPENCLAPEEFPGFDPAHPSSFSRDEGQFGICGAFVVADFLGVRLSTFKRWPTSPDYDRGVSTVDIEIQSFAHENDEIQKNTIEYFLGPISSEFGLWDSPTKKTFKDYLVTEEESGVCPENAMPGDIRVNGNGNQIRAVYESFDAHLKELQSRTRTGVSLASICKECKLIAPELSDEQWEQVAGVLNSVNNLDQGSFKILKAIDDIACDGKRIKVPLLFTQVRDVNIDDLANRLAALKHPVQMSVHAQPLDPDHIKPGPEQASNPSWDRHSFLVYGATIKNVNGTNVCFYKVKNSWGPNLCMQVWGSKNSPKVQCDPSTGSYLISSDLLQSMSLGIER
jgi:hypothetical protein